MSDIAVEENVTPPNGKQLSAVPAQRLPRTQQTWTSQLLQGTDFANRDPAATDPGLDTPNGNGARQRFTLDGMVLEQRWVGRVEAVRGDQFDVVMRDENSGDEEFTTVDMSQLVDSDVERIVEGAPFEWLLGHVDVDARRVGVSYIVLITPHRLSDEEKREALDAGAELEATLLAGESHRTTFD